MVEGQAHQAKACNPSRPKTISKLLEDPSQDWDPDQTIGDNDLEDVGWIIPPALKSLTLCSVEPGQDQSARCYLHAASWPVEVSLEEAAQDLSNHRYLISQEF